MKRREPNTFEVSLPHNEHWNDGEGHVDVITSDETGHTTKEHSNNPIAMALGVGFGLFTAVLSSLNSNSE